MGKIKIIQNKVITIDCDEVLCDTVGYMLKHTDFFGDKNYQDIDLEKLTHMYHYIHESLDQIMMKDSKWITNMLPIPSAPEQLAKLVEQWYVLYVITGRTDNMRDFTYQWLEYYFPGMIKEVFFCNNYKSKAIAKIDVCRKVGSALMIDDDPRFIDDIQHIPVMLFDRPRNKNYNGDHAQRVDSWEIILQQLLK